MDAAHLAEKEGGLMEQDSQLEPRGISAFQTGVTFKLSSLSTRIGIAPSSFKQETVSLKYRMRWWLYIVISPDK